MGGEVFGNFARGRKAKDAFDSIVAEARYMHGHGGYTGTIAEKTSFVMIGEFKPTGTGDLEADKEAAILFAEELLDEDDSRIADKWGPAGCIKVGMYDDVEGLRLYYFFGVASS